MPCYTVQYASVEFKAKHLKILEEAAKRLGYRYEERNNTVYLSNGFSAIKIDLNNQLAEVRRNEQDKLNELKREYSKVGLEQLSKKRKFVLNMKKDQTFEMRRY